VLEQSEASPLDHTTNNIIALKGRHIPRLQRFKQTLATLNLGR
jgi:hypothetical protein